MLYLCLRKQSSFEAGQGPAPLAQRATPDRQLLARADRQGSARPLGAGPPEAGQMMGLPPVTAMVAPDV
ncbi:hypothetical protein EBL87_02545 [Cereibacter sphaeroides]|nr:hypothetical protein EBL87_02545 [Cereibacter sphaeroides]AZB69386.1 hypothetical protein EBL86_13875 [Cereibacter sphaeroides]